MSEHVIMLTDRQGKGGATLYVNQPGSRRSYTSNILQARRFPSREAAQAECCGNEMPVNRWEAIEEVSA